MTNIPNFLWQPLLEGAGQTLAGILGGYAVTKVVSKLSSRNMFEGAMDLWRRGINNQVVSAGDNIVFDGLISPYTQLFPGDPMRNGTRWNPLYDFQGKISKDEFQAMEFFASADVALRLKSLNGDTIVGLYGRYGYVGEGLLGVVPTKYITKAIPNFFHPDFFGARARIYGQLDICPSAHYAAAKEIAAKAGMKIDLRDYRKLYYLRVNSIALASKDRDKVCTLLGSPWAVTESKRDQYLVQYGYISEPAERRRCLETIFSKQAWSKARVFFDDVGNPSDELSFKKTFIS